MVSVHASCRPDANRATVHISWRGPLAATPTPAALVPRLVHAEEPGRELVGGAVVSSRPFLDPGSTRPPPSARDGLEGPSPGLLAEHGDAGRGEDERAGAEREHPAVARDGEEDADQVGADQ